MKKYAQAIVGAAGVTGEGAYRKNRRGTLGDLDWITWLHKEWGVNNGVWEYITIRPADSEVGAAHSSCEGDVMSLEQRGCTSAMLTTKLGDPLE